MPEPTYDSDHSVELSAEELELEGQLRGLLTLPAPPADLDARILEAATRRAGEVREAGEQRQVRARARGRILRLSFGYASAAAGLLVAAALSAQLGAPSASSHATTELSRDGIQLSALGEAKILAAEGAMGRGGRTILANDWIDSGELVAVRPEGYLKLGLACGTELVLDGGSRATLQFTSRERRVHLERGRFYANVVKVGTTPEVRPIVVRAPGGQTRVLGTELMVKASAARSQVTVRHGTVRLENPHGQTLVTASQSGLLTADSAPRARLLSSVDRQFRWIGKIQQGPRHPSEKPFGGGPVTEDEAAIGTLTARRSDGSAEPLRLVDQQVSSWIQNGVATTTVRFTFSNTSPEDLEGTFQFALPKSASISRYAVTIRGELVEGRVVERERARAIYEEQKRRLEDPALLEWSQGNAFTARVYPIEARSQKRIEIAYTQELPEHYGVSKLVLPLVSEASQAHPPERLSIEVRLAGAEATSGIRCPSHYARLGFSGGTAVVSLEATALRPRNDFVLEIARAEAPRAEGWLEPPAQPGESATAHVRLRPNLHRASAVATGPLVVVCDASNSQAGTLKEVQLELLEGLLRRAGRARVFVAHVDVEELDAAGSQNPADALLASLWRYETGGALDLSRSIYQLGRLLPPDGGATLVYLGDGVATAGRRSDAAVARAFQRALPPAAIRRLIAVGLGSNTNDALLSRLARERGGVLVSVRSGDDLGQKLDEVVSVLSEPVLSQVDVRLELTGVQELSPRKPRNLRAGETLDLLARVRGSGQGPSSPVDGHVVLSGLLGGRVYETVLPLQLLQTQPGEALAQLWARKRVGDLHEQGPRSKDEIVDLALRYGLVTPHTSLLVLKPEEFERYKIQRRDAVGPVVARLVKDAARRVHAGDLDEAERLLEALIRKDPGGEQNATIWNLIQQRRAALVAAAQDAQRRADAPPTVDDPFGENLDPNAWAEWLAHDGLSLSGTPSDDLVVEFYDVSGIVKDARDYPAPELGLNRDKGGGGGVGGVVTFKEDAGRSTTGHTINSHKLIELVEGLGEGGSTEYSAGTLIVRKSRGEQNRVEDLLAGLSDAEKKPRAIHEVRKQVEHLEKRQRALVTGSRKRRAIAEGQVARLGELQHELEEELGRDREVALSLARLESEKGQLEGRVKRRLKEIEEKVQSAEGKLGLLVKEDAKPRERKRQEVWKRLEKARGDDDSGEVVATGEALDHLETKKKAEDFPGDRIRVAGDSAPANNGAFSFEEVRGKQQAAEGDKALSQSGELTRSAINEKRRAAITQRGEEKANKTKAAHNLRLAAGREVKLPQTKTASPNGRKVVADYDLSSGGTGVVTSDLVDESSVANTAPSDPGTSAATPKASREWVKDQRHALDEDGRSGSHADEWRVAKRPDSLYSGAPLAGSSNPIDEVVLDTFGQVNVPKGSSSGPKGTRVGYGYRDAQGQTRGRWGQLAEGTYALPLEESAGDGFQIIVDGTDADGALKDITRQVYFARAVTDENLFTAVAGEGLVSFSTGAVNVNSADQETLRALLRGEKVSAQQVAELGLERSMAQLRSDKDRAEALASSGVERAVSELRRNGLAAQQYSDDKRFYPHAVTSDLEVNQTGVIPVQNPVVGRLSVEQLGRELDAASPTERGAVFDRLLQYTDPQEDPETALDALAHLLRFAPDRLELHEKAGSAYVLLGQVHEALRAFSGLVEARPDDAEAHWRFAHALRGLGLSKRAMVELHECVRLEPDVARYRMGLAQLARLTGKTQLAERTYLGVLRRNFHPEQGEVQTAARVQLLSMWVAELRQGDSPRHAKLRESVQRLERGALLQRPVRIRAQVTRGAAALTVAAPGDPIVTSAAPFAPSGGRLAQAEFTHTRLANGTWVVSVTAGPEGALGVLRLLVNEGTQAGRVLALPFELTPGATAKVYEGPL